MVLVVSELFPCRPWHAWTTVTNRFLFKAPVLVGAFAAGPSVCARRPLGDGNICYIDKVVVCGGAIRIFAIAIAIRAIGCSGGHAPELLTR